MERKKTARKKAPRRQQRQNRPIPAAVGTTVSTRLPNVQQSSRSDGRIRISHRELVAAVASNTAFNTAIKAYEVNPGLSATFPWLHSLARAYENYEFQELRFIYEPTCGTTSTGCIYMALDYDANDDWPTDEKDMSAFHGAVIGPLYQPSTFISDKSCLSRFKGQRFMRYSPQDDTDIKTYDLGTLFIAAVSATAFACGNLFVEYTVDLMVPGKPDWMEAFDQSLKISSGPSDRTQPFVGATYTGDTNTASTGHDGVGGYFNTAWFKRAGQYLIELYGSGGTTTATAPVATIMNGANGDINAALTKVLGQLTNAAATNFIDTYIFKTTRPNTGLAFDFTNGMASINGLQARISPYEYANA